MPVAAEVALVAPVIAHVSNVTPQLSAVVGFVVTTEALHVAPVVAVIFDGQEMVGKEVSFIATVYEHVPLFPAASRTVYVTVVTPALNVYVPMLLIPVAAEVAVVAPVIAHVNTVTPQLSAVVGFVVTILLEHVPAVTVFVMFAGQVIVGRVASVTVTVKKHVAILPAASLTV